MPIIYITPKQREYIQILSDDLQFTRKQKIVHIRSIISREIEDLDILSKHEASIVINKFKEWKDIQAYRKVKENTHGTENLH